MKKRNYLFNIFIFVTFLTIAIVLTKRTFQNDTFYTIKVGESILKNGVDMKEHFSWISNLQYTYPHWLYDVMIFLIYDLFSFFGLYISSIFFFMILMFTSFFTTVKISKNKELSFLLVVVSYLTFSSFVTARAQLVSYTFLLMILYSIEMLRENGNKKYYFYIFISSLLIANIHLAVWPFIFVLYLPFLANDIIYLFKSKLKIKIFDNFNIQIDKSSFKVLGIVFLVTFITGFLTPNFLVPFTYLINTARGISTKYIAEHLPTTIKAFPFLFVYLLIVVIMFLYKKNKIKLCDLFLISGLFLLSLLSKRSYSLFVVLTIYSISRLFNYFNYYYIKYILNNKYFLTIIGVFLLCVSGVAYKHYESRHYINEKLYPVLASNYIKDNLDYENIRLYNQYNFGSYLLYENIPVFIDSRADLYLEEFNKSCNVFKDEMTMDSNYNEVFKKYSITHAIVSNDSTLYNYLKLGNNYDILYYDEYFTIFEILTK